MYCCDLGGEQGCRTGRTTSLVFGTSHGRGPSSEIWTVHHLLEELGFSLFFISVYVKERQTDRWMDQQRQNVHVLKACKCHGVHMEVKGKL